LLWYVILMSICIIFRIRMGSECVKNHLNEVITVNNAANLYFDNLSQAIICGIDKAQHDLIVVVHEDVLLVNGWQVRFEQSLMKLEEYDDQWAVLGSVGWSKDGKVRGHWSDPHCYKNTFNKVLPSYCEVERLDEQILIFHRSRLPALDKNLPGIHHIGRDIAAGGRKSGLKAYAIDAPTIHKHRDGNGQLVLRHEESEKIMDRKSLTYQADKYCCDDYIAFKWPELTSLYNGSDEFHIPFSETGKLLQLRRPLILLSRGGSGSRLLSNLVEDTGIFLGNQLNSSGDSMELVVPFYRAIVEKYRCKAKWQRQQTVPRIRASAARMIKNLPEDKAWGFKIPESILLLPELALAFPDAAYVHLVRDPETTCLRRTHMTARLDNHIGRISLPLAYDFFNIDRNQILDDNPAVHMAYTTAHQLELIQGLASRTENLQFIEFRFEDLITWPQDIMNSLCNWLKVERKMFRKADRIDISRANRPKVAYPESVVENVKRILTAIRIRLRYKDEV